MRMAVFGMVTLGFWGIVITVIASICMYASAQKAGRNPNGYTYFFSTFGIVAAIFIFCSVYTGYAVHKEATNIKNQVKQDITIYSDTQYDAEYFNSTDTEKGMKVSNITWTSGGGSYEISDEEEFFTISGEGEVDIKFCGSFYDSEYRTGHYIVVSNE